MTVITASVSDVAGDALLALARGITTTLLLTVAAFALGCACGAPLALARRSATAWLRVPASVFVELVRGVPPIAWLFLIYFGLAQQGWLALDTTTAAVAGLGAIAAGHLCEIMRAAVGAVPRGQWEAARAVGLPRLRLYGEVIAPQAVRVAVPMAATFAIGLLKDSAVASTIGAQEITFQAFEQSQRHADGLTVFLVAGLLYAALSLPLATLTRRLDRRLSAGLAR
jgi:polar amino acid transport system permease protein